MEIISEQQKQNARQLGIALSHYDIDGHFIEAKPSTLDYFINLLQPGATTKAKNKNQFDDVMTANENQPVTYQLSRLALTRDIPITYQLVDDTGNVLLQQTHSSSRPIILPPQPYGYYALQISQDQANYRVRLLIQPETAYQPPLVTEKKAWGLTIQLYSLRSERNWGIGDFGDLRYLIERAAALGADFVGINPLHLLYPAVPEWASPYSASSRRWLNYIYLDIPALPEFGLCKIARQRIDELQPQIAELRRSETVNYAAVSQLKLSILNQLFAFFNRSKSRNIDARRKRFKQFVKEQGEALLYQGLFNVLDCQENAFLPDDDNKIGWLGWREELRHLSAKKRRALLTQHKDQVMFYAWLQWITYEQLDEVKRFCLDSGMRLGIYGDLATNSSRGGADVWSDKEVYCVDVSVGAPPDPLGPVGQNWNLPPYNPSVLKARGFQPFIDMLRANMQHFGVLRIDHIIGLFRLWLIPPGKSAVDGLYVHYQFDALMAILAIESQRNRCLIVGEDLGTVPDEVRSKLKEFCILSYFVLYFAQTGHVFPHAKDFPSNAFATIGTHDVPSLQSFWHCRDLALFGELKVLTGDFLKQKYDQRLQDKQALLNALHRDDYLSPEYQGDALSMAMHDNLNLVIHRYLAESRSKLIGVQLENLLSQEVSFNLPGTNYEYPNWRKKLSRPLERIFDDEHIVSFLTLINQARNR